MRVLFRGGRRELLEFALAELVGDGVEVDMMSRAVGDCIIAAARTAQCSSVLTASAGNKDFTVEGVPSLK